MAAWLQAGRGINYRALNDLFTIRDARCDEVRHGATVLCFKPFETAIRCEEVGESCLH